MKKSTLIVTVAIAFLSLMSACEPKNTEPDIRNANEKFYAALNSMFTGDLEPLNSIWAHDTAITNMGPFGSCLVGWDAVNAEFKKEAEMKLGGKVICEDLHIYAGTNMGYAVCVEVGENMTAEGKHVRVSHRATNIFQLKDGHWKMIHHHTDLSPQLEAAVDMKTK
jgi:ketosteroid isomerase-like protein